MKVTKLKLANFGRFSDLEVAFAPTDHVKSNVTLLIGNNGAGKTSILEAIAVSLSWFVSRVRTEKGNGSPIREELIKNGANWASIEIDVSDDQVRTITRPIEDIEGESESVSWRLVRAKTGRKSEVNSDLSGASQLADQYRTKLTFDDKADLPLVAYYPTERVVLEIPMRIKGKHQFDQVDGYENSLSKGIDFRRFFEWFRAREDEENESGISNDAFRELSKLFRTDDEIWKKFSQWKASSRDRQLMAVRSAISAFMPGFSELRIRRKPRLHMAVEKDGETLDVGILSQGEKSMLALVGDVARRLAMMNPARENPLHGEGIVLIDEVDLHFHPKWQKTLVERLRTTFPNCQFILTTHSPLVVSDTKDMLVYSLDDGELNALEDLYGMDVNNALATAMDVSPRNEKIDKMINTLLVAIQNGHIGVAKAALKIIKEELPEDHLEITKANLLLKKLELRHAKDHKKE